MNQDYNTALLHRYLYHEPFIDHPHVAKIKRQANFIRTMTEVLLYSSWTFIGLKFLGWIVGVDTPLEIGWGMKFIGD